MDIGLFGRGLLVGSSIAAPVGPIGVLCIRRTLTLGRLAGLLSGLGAATADAVYGAIAAYGLTAISGILVGRSFWFRLVGGIFLNLLRGADVFSKTSDKTSRAGGFSQCSGAGRCLLFYRGVNDYKPGHDYVVCRRICWVGVGQHRDVFTSRSPSRYDASAGGVCGVCAVVAAAEQCR